MYCPGCRNRISDMSAECPVCGLKLRNVRTSHSPVDYEYDVYSRERRKPSASPGKFYTSLFLLVIVLALSRSAWYKLIAPPPQKIESPHEYTSQNSEALEVPLTEQEVLPQVTNAKDVTVPAPTVTEERPTIPATEEIIEPPAVQTEAPSSNSQIGSVLRSAGEVRIRSGPSTSYEDIGRLKGGTPIRIYEQQQEASGRWWGRMDDGWVCMDYIVFGEDSSVAPPNSNSEMNGSNSIIGIYGGDSGSVKIGYNEYDGSYFAQIEIIRLTSLELDGYFDTNTRTLYLSGRDVVICDEWSSIDIALTFDAYSENMTLVVDHSTNEMLPVGYAEVYTRAWNE